LLSVLSGPGRLAAGNYEEGWSQIDGEEQAMAADDGSWMEWNGRRFRRLQEEANGSLMGFWGSLITRRRRISKEGEEEEETEEAIFCRERAMRSSVS